MDGALVEKKVPLPDRWLRGFAEVLVSTAGFDPRAELAGHDAVRFLRSLPRGRGRTAWAVPAGRTLRLASRPAPGAVCLAGPDRLRTMLPLLRFARALRAYGPSVRGGSGPVSSVWELELPGMRYVLALSPERARGFSGEGAVLDALATDEAAGDADLIGALVSFEPRVEPDLLAERSGLSLDRTKAALVQLGTSGRVGFDTAEAAFFHRELPYDPSRVAALNPRLRSARALVEDSSVRFTGDGTAVVTTEGGERHVRFTGDGEAASCTCPWWYDHRTGASGARASTSSRPGSSGGTPRSESRRDRGLDGRPGRHRREGRRTGRGARRRTRRRGPPPGPRLDGNFVPRPASSPR